MPYQDYAADGTTLVSPKYVKQEVLDLLKLSTIPKGLIGLNTKAGLAEVVQTASKKSVFMKLGKLLNQQGLEEKIVRETSQILTELKLLYENEVSFAYTEEEILSVYREGPSSCMSNCDSVKIYSNNYTAVAYLEVKGKVLARTVICKDKNTGLSYSSLYGFGEPLAKMLEELGYTRGDLEGCRLPLEYDCNGDILCPYLDGTRGIDVEGDELVIVDGGEIEASGTDGILVGHTCDECYDNIHASNVHYSEHTDQHLCESCYEACHILVNDNAYHIEDEDIQRLENFEYVLAEEAEYLDYRDEWHATEDCVFNNYVGEYILRTDLDL